METNQKFSRYISSLATGVLQMIMTQVVTFVASLLLPGMENFPQTKPGLFTLLVGAAFFAGAFFTGWLAIKVRFLKLEIKLLPRLVGTLVGAYLPFVLALLIYHPLEAGNFFFMIAPLITVLGFYAPEWLPKKLFG